jgi:hypothetical protein
VVFGLSVFMVPGAGTNFVRQNLPPEAWGRAISLFTQVFAVARIAGPYGAGPVADLFGSIGISLLAAAGDDGGARKTPADAEKPELWVRGQNNVFYRVKQGGQQVSFSFDDLATITPAQRMEPHNRTQQAQRRFRERLSSDTQRLREQVEAEDAARNAQGAR